MVTAVRNPISIGLRCLEGGKVDKDSHLPSIDLIDEWGDEGKFISPPLFKIHSSQTKTTQT